jgi:predicted DNA-binding protein (UPF0278 family)
MKIHDCKNDNTIFNTEKWVKYEDHVELTNKLNEEIRELREKIKEAYNDGFFDSKFDFDIENYIETK